MPSAKTATKKAAILDEDGCIRLDLLALFVRSRASGFFQLLKIVSSLISIEAAAVFSSRCFTLDVPGMGSITGDLFSSQARAKLGDGGVMLLGDGVQRAAGAR